MRAKMDEQTKSHNSRTDPSSCPDCKLGSEFQASSEYGFCILSQVRLRPIHLVTLLNSPAHAE